MSVIGAVRPWLRVSMLLLTSSGCSAAGGVSDAQFSKGVDRLDALLQTCKAMPEEKCLSDVRFEISRIAAISNGTKSAAQGKLISGVVVPGALGLYDRLRELNSAESLGVRRLDEAICMLSASEEVRRTWRDEVVRRMREQEAFVTFFIAGDRETDFLDRRRAADSARIYRQVLEEKRAKYGFQTEFCKVLSGIVETYAAHKM
jgi:hypothetical protein